MLRILEIIDKDGNAGSPFLEFRNLSLIIIGRTLFYSKDVSPYHITSIIHEDMFQMFNNLNVLSFRFFGFSWR